MSNDVLHIVPVVPDYVPPESVRNNARQLVSHMAPKAESVETIVHPQTTFVDPGENYEEVKCPSCGSDIEMDWWQDAMAAASEADFADLSVQVPCCGKEQSLNDLDYQWPAGFARFVIEVNEPGIDGDFLGDDLIKEIGAALGVAVKQVRAHY